LSYIDWFNNHSKKHQKIVDRLLANNLSQDEIIDYFDFDNMVKNEIDFCPLYKDNKKCHNIDELNCYLCGCPNFRFDDSGIDIVDNITTMSICSIDNGDKLRVGDKIHQDCSKCSIPHHKDYIKKHFDYSWSKIMSKTIKD